MPTANTLPAADGVTLSAPVNEQDVSSPHLTPTASEHAVDDQLPKPVDDKLQRQDNKLQRARGKLTKEAAKIHKKRARLVRRESKALLKAEQKDFRAAEKDAIRAEKMVRRKQVRARLEAKIAFRRAQISQFYRDGDDLDAEGRLRTIKEGYDSELQLDHGHQRPSIPLHTLGYQPSPVLCPTCGHTLVSKVKRRVGLTQQ